MSVALHQAHYSDSSAHMEDLGVQAETAWLSVPGDELQPWGQDQSLGRASVGGLFPSASPAPQPQPLHPSLLPWLAQQGLPAPQPFAGGLLGRLQGREEAEDSGSLGWEGEEEDGSQAMGGRALLPAPGQASGGPPNQQQQQHGQQVWAQPPSAPPAAGVPGPGLLQLGQAAAALQQLTSRLRPLSQNLQDHQGSW